MLNTFLWLALADVILRVSESKTIQSVVVSQWVNVRPLIVYELVVVIVLKL